MLVFICIHLGDTHISFQYARECLMQTQNSSWGWLPPHWNSQGKQDCTIRSQHCLPNDETLVSFYISPKRCSKAKFYNLIACKSKINHGLPPWSPALSKRGWRISDFDRLSSVVLPALTGLTPSFALMVLMLIFLVEGPADTALPCLAIRSDLSLGGRPFINMAELTYTTQNLYTKQEYIRIQDSLWFPLHRFQLYVWSWVLPLPCPECFLSKNTRHLWSSYDTASHWNHSFPWAAVAAEVIAVEECLYKRRNWWSWSKADFSRHR